MKSSNEGLLQKSQQLVVVTTRDWQSVPGRLQCFERTGTQQTWRRVGVENDVVVGRNGLAWGRGLHPMVAIAPQKIEGDGKSPAGTFGLSSAFGFAAVNEMTLVKLPYVQVTDTLECVDDVQSSSYNLMVDRAQMAKPDWKSSEKMRAIGEEYRLGIVVDHNEVARVAGGGSCIFLHVWKGADSATSGCTAMAKDNMERLLSWLDPRANPLLVQLPQAEYSKRETPWRLPALKNSRSTD